MMAGLLLATPVMTTGSSATTQASEDTSDDHGDARREKGLQADEEHMRRQDLSPGYDVGLGFPITAEERTEMRRRDATGLKMVQLDAQFRSGGEIAYAGWYMDHAAGGVATVWLQNPTSSDHGRVRAAAGEKYKFLAPEYAWQDLEAAWQGVREFDSERTPTGDALVRSSAASYRSNSVEVTVSPNATEEQSHRLRSAHPSIVLQAGQVELIANRDDGSQRAYGGMVIQSSSGGCTASTSARASDGSYYVLTAGHCGRSNTSWTLGSYNTRSIGVGRLKNGYYDYGPSETSYCDCQLVGQVAASTATNQAIVETAASTVTPRWRRSRTTTWTDRSASAAIRRPGRRGTSCSAASSPRSTCASRVTTRRTRNGTPT